MQSQEGLLGVQPYRKKPKPCWNVFAGAVFVLMAVGMAAVLVWWGVTHKDATTAPPPIATASVVMTRLSDQPMIDRSMSDFDYTYNPASFVSNAGDNYLLTRVQNYNHSIGPYAVGPSMMALAKLSGPLLNVSGKVSFVDFQPQEPFEKCGTEDPRIVQHDGTTYLMYTAYDCKKAQLSLATSTNPSDPASWVRHGPLFPELPWSKSGAVLIRAQPPHYMFFGDSTFVPGLRIATSSNLVNWTIVKNATGGDKLLIKVRKDSFDSQLVEGGPPPVQLSNGSYLFVYNSARAGFPSPKPGYDYQYNPGYVILDETDPTKILHRASSPLLTPTLSWETGNNTAPPRSLTPNVIFVEARLPTPGASDSWLYYYGAADTDIGVAQLNVTL